MPFPNTTYTYAQKLVNALKFTPFFTHTDTFPAHTPSYDQQSAGSKRNVTQKDPLNTAGSCLLVCHIHIVLSVNFSVYLYYLKVQ